MQLVMEHRKDSLPSTSHSSFSYNTHTLALVIRNDFIFRVLIFCWNHVNLSHVCIHLLEPHQFDWSFLAFCSCAILVVSHGDPLQILQTILNAVKEDKEPSCSNLGSRIEAVRVPSILSQHRKFALLTGELRAVIWVRIVASF